MFAHTIAVFASATKKGIVQGEVNMGQPLKVLFLMEDLCFGGTQKQNLALACGLDRKRFAPSMLTLTGPTDLDGIAAKGGITPLHMGRSRKVPPLFFARLGNWLASIKPDILVPCTALPNIWGRLWGKFLKIPVIIGTCRGGGAPKRQHEAILWRLSSHIVCNSSALVKDMRAHGVPEHHLSYIPNGVDSALFRAREIDHKDPLIVCVARLAADKDHQTLLRAFAIAAQEMPNVRLRLVGEGPEEERLRKFVLRSLEPHVAERVEFSGASANPLEHYQEADIFALTSVREGQPNVILEAMSVGLPVCATAVGGIPALVTDRETGFLSGPGDYESLAQNLLVLLRDPDLGHSFGATARSHVENRFSFTAMIEAHQDLFEKKWHEYCQQQKRV